MQLQYISLEIKQAQECQQTSDYQVTKKVEHIGWGTSSMGHMNSSYRNPETMQLCIVIGAQL